MINPNMATMLSVITTDAAVSQPLLQSALAYASAKSFNACTIDGDTSTNDTVVVLANGASGVKIEKEDSKQYVEFRDQLSELCEVLAIEMVRGGEVRGERKCKGLFLLNFKSQGSDKVGDRSRCQCSIAW
jgi:glutamate N-acetyltransferase/amino-acid N-acetyltransferase